ncbi:unnamed protein product [Rotaria magnacalcarata]
MASKSVGKYKKLLEKDNKVGDKYVIIDKKWLEHWKRYAGIEKSDEEKPTKPGPIDFTSLADPTTANSSNEVQVRANAVEGNDYSFIPYELYQELVVTYKKEGQEIIRKVIPLGEYSTTIEVFLVPLRLRESRASYANSKQIYRSRRTKVEDLKKDICNEYRIPMSANYRLYASTDEKGFDWEPISEQANLTLDDADLTKNAFITYESRNISTHSSSSSNKPYYDVGSKSHYTPGLCGLSNLGKTCFMNSALQCLSNVPPLTAYFLGQYEDHINRDNPLGMKGDVAKAYGDLIREIWSGKSSFCTPKSLNQNVARYAPQFSGFSQHDSLEFMSFLLDSLHEDLNLVKKKPYVEKKDDDGKLTDSALAAEQWEYYRKRNQSRIHEIFHGQIKSIVTCLTCGTQARAFDPICFLSLPLPDKAKIRIFKLDYVRLNGQIKSYSIKCGENGRIHNLIQEFCGHFQPKNKSIRQKEPMNTDSAASNSNPSNRNDDDENDEEEEEEDFTKASDYDGHQPKPDYILAVEIYNHRVHLQYGDNTLLTSILERDRVVFYEVPDSLKKSDSMTILMPCTFRDDYYHYNFGLPIYLSVPRHDCKGKDIQEALQKVIGNFIPLSTTDPSENKSLYSASLVFTQNNSPTIKPLKSYLDEHIDFSRNKTALTVDVAATIVDKYKKLESDIQIRRQKDASATLLDCFKHFTKKVVLSDDDLWYCRKCAVFKKATKKIDLWLLPKVLIVQLTRFSQTGDNWNTNDLLIDCPIRSLDLSNFVVNPTENAKYDLIAVSNHMGSLKDGHYTTYAKNSHDKKWYRFNDARITEIKEDNVISKAAYVLIYQRQS